MEISYFEQLADYNIWANDLMHSWFDQISEYQWNQHISSSFNSIGLTAIHTVGAEKIWLERLEKVPTPVWIPNTFVGTKQELIKEWKSASMGLKHFISNFDETRLNEVLHFTRINGDKQSSKFYQIFAHVMNHSTYHRGQIVTMLRQVGFTDVASTDMVGYFRKINELQL